MASETTTANEALILELTVLADRIRETEEHAAALMAARTPLWAQAIRAGVTVRAIGQIFGLQDQSVKFHLKRAGVPIPRQPRHQRQPTY